MSYNYVVTAQKSTAVFNCVRGSFTGPNDLNLIVEKLFRIEVYLLTVDGLRLLKEISLNGRISVLKSFRMPNENKDYLFVVTMKFNALVLEISRDAEKGTFEIITRANGVICDRVGRQAENGFLCVINPKTSTIALRIYDGLVNIMKLDFASKEIKSYNVRMEENVLVDIAFLNGFNTPMLCIIYQDEQSRHLKTYEITEDRELKRGPWKQENIESESNLLIPVSEPNGGVIVIGQESIIYIVEQNNFTAIAPPILRRSSVSCYCEVDQSRFLIGDMSGRLFLLILLPSSEEEMKSNPTSSSVSPSFSLKLIYLGEVSIAQCLAYLDNAYIYVGSRLGDSQLIKLNIESNDSGNYIEVVDSYVNLAPISDLLVIDLDKQGQDQLVTCSGFSKEGSIRIIRNGIGINEYATIDLPGIKGVWQLKVNSQMDNVIAIAFVGQTKLLMLINEEVEETRITGFDCSQQTLFCGNISNDLPELILQVTTTTIRLISCKEDKVINEWIPPNNISLVSTNFGQIICSSRTTLYYLEVIDSEIKLVTQLQMEYEASCLDINPLEQERSKFCSVGLWKEISVRILSLPDLKLLHTEKLGGEIIPRSTIMAHFDLTSYLFIAIGDGSLLYYILNDETGVLSEKKKVILGTHPTLLRMFNTNHSANIFACSDRPTVIYSSNNKLVFSNVNLKEVNHMCTLNSSGYPDSLILTNDNQLLIGQIDQIQKLHIRTIQLGETPRRIAYQESTHTFGVLTMRHDVQGEDGQMVPIVPNSASCLAQNITYSSSLPSIVKPSNLTTMTDQYETEVYHLLIIDQQTFEVLHAHQFMANEFALSITSAKLGDDPNCYYIVGTSFINPDELEPKTGRIIIFHLTDGKLQQVAEKDIKGAPYVLLEFNGKLLTAINSTIRLFEWTQMHDLHNECTYFNSVLTYFLKTKGDFVVAGDLLRSISLLSYKPLGGTFDEIAADPETSWLSSIEIIDDDTFIASDNSFNLFVVQKDYLIQDSDRHRLKPVGAFHLGDFINVMKHGSLVMNYPCEVTCPILHKPIIYGSNSGSIGLIAQIPETFHKFLKGLQKNIVGITKTVGKIDYDYWRAFSSEKKFEPSQNFIDGDVIESFLDLSRKEMEQCIKDLMIEIQGEQKEVNVDDVIKIVEELSRIH